MTRRLVAEQVAQGHPDRLADRLAETIVERIQRADPDAAVGIEVALHRRTVLVTGHLAVREGNGEVRAEASTAELADWLGEIAAEVLGGSGYGGRWALPVTVTADVEVEPLTAEHVAARGFSCDQDVVIGHATPDDDLGNLPVEVVAARVAAAAYDRVAQAEPDLVGPDGKVLVVLRPDGPRAVVELLNISALHPVEVGYGDLYREVAAAVVEELRGVPRLGVPDAVDPRWCTVNGAGPFVLAGPLGDGGLSGKKLVADLYGPAVPVGGGALCGKDAFKADRCGPLRARQVAVRLARATGLESTVWAGWFPGQERPSFLWARLGDGRELDAAEVDRLVGLPDLSIGRTVSELELTAQPWSQHVVDGYVGAGHPWDRG